MPNVASGRCPGPSVPATHGITRMANFRAGIQLRMGDGMRRFALHTKLVATRGRADRLASKFISNQLRFSGRTLLAS